mgnify:CR=1 FL=1
MFISFRRKAVWGFAIPQLPYASFILAGFLLFQVGISGVFAQALPSSITPRPSSFGGGDTISLSMDIGTEEAQAENITSIQLTYTCQGCKIDTLSVLGFDFSNSWFGSSSEIDYEYSIHGGDSMLTFTFTHNTSHSLFFAVFNIWRCVLFDGL